jgi:hypothetical protein
MAEVAVVSTRDPDAYLVLEDRVKVVEAARNRRLGLGPGAPQREGHREQDETGDD